MNWNLLLIELNRIIAKTMGQFKERVLKKIYRQYASRFRFLMNYPPYKSAMNKEILKSGDPIRYAFIACALARIVKEKIEGGIAEVGVFVVRAIAGKARRLSRNFPSISAAICCASAALPPFPNR